MEVGWITWMDLLIDRRMEGMNGEREGEGWGEMKRLMDGCTDERWKVGRTKFYGMHVSKYIYSTYSTYWCTRR